MFYYKYSKQKQKNIRYSYTYVCDNVGYVSLKPLLKLSVHNSFTPTMYKHANNFQHGKIQSAIKYLHTVHGNRRSCLWDVSKWERSHTVSWQQNGMHAGNTEIPRNLVHDWCPTYNEMPTLWHGKQNLASLKPYWSNILLNNISYIYLKTWKMTVV